MRSVGRLMLGSRGVPGRSAEHGVDWVDRSAGLKKGSVDLTTPAGGEWVPLNTLEGRFLVQFPCHE